MRSLLLTILLLLTACGSNDVIDSFSPEVVNDRTIAKHFIDPDLQPYIDDYMRFARDNGLGDGRIAEMRRVEFVDSFEDTKVGVCERYSYEGPRSERWWIIKILRRPYGEYEFRSLMMHELAHCVHDSNHTDGATHIMNSRLNHEEVVSSMWGNLLDSLAEHIRHGR